MENRIKLSSFLIALLLLFSGCSSKPETLDPEKYLKWIADEENGLAKSKTVKNVFMRARMLPTDFLAYKEFSSNDSVSFDSLKASYACGLTFQLTVQADKETNNEYANLMQYGLANEQAFIQRSHFLSFDIQDFISLRHGSDTFLPVLAQFEGYDAIGNRLSFQVVFDLKEYECGSSQNTLGDVTLIFEDPFWDLGVNNFLFEKEDYGSLPQIEM